MKNTVKIAAFGAAMVLGSQANAHQVFSDTFTLPVIAAGASHSVTITCPHHHYSVSGGFAGGDRMDPNGPINVTASYPDSTRSWTVEFTNGSGRPTGAMEATATIYVTCDHHW